MAQKFYRKPFDDGTKIKLTLFETYIRDWLPVFIRQTNNYYKTINIFDFFAGPGQDKNGVEGSPLISFKSLNYYYHKIVENNFSVSLFFNEIRDENLEILQDLINTRGYDKKPVQLHLSSEDFPVAFEKYYGLMNQPKTANFLFLDQFGIKQITCEIFKKILLLETTDFLFFISSSTIRRFVDHPDINKYLNISKRKITDSDYIQIHRVVFEYYKSLVPKNREYYLASFAIKKGANIYGLIFGSGHVLGIDKFLSKCWRIDPERGEANFDIDQDNIPKNQYSLFPDMHKPKKLRLFEENLTNRIIRKELVSNKDIYCYTLQNGFTAKHSREIINRLKSDKIIPNQKINISYDSCFKKNIIQQIKLD